MFSKQDKFYIELIKFGVDNIDSGVTIDEAKEHLENKGYKLQEMSHFFLETFNQSFQKQLYDLTQVMNKSKCKTLKFTIRMKAYFSYIQYKANRQTAYAFYASILSVIIATVLLCLSFTTK